MKKMHSPPYQWFLAYAIVGCLILNLVSCGSQVGKPSATAPVASMEPGEAVFKEGFNAYQQGELNEALGRLSEYLANYPRGRHAPEALYLMADVYRLQGHNDAAQAFFERLAVEYPNAPRTEAARLAIVELMIAAGRSEEALASAKSLLDEAESEETRMALLEGMYHVHYDRGEFGIAGYYAFLLYQSDDQTGKDQWRQLFVESSALMESEEIETIWEFVDDPDLHSYLIYRFALIQVIREQYDKALEMFSLFHQQFPEHPFADEAINLIVTLTQRLTFEPYTLGCLLPLSGPYAPYGLRALHGIELALSLLQGGEVAHPIKLVVKDTGSESAQTVRAVRELADSGAAAIIGPFISAPAAAKEAQRLQIPMVTITQKAGVTDIGPYIFRHFITPQNQVRTLIDYFIDAIGLTEFAVLYPQDTYGKAFVNYFWDEIIHRGGRMVGVETYDAAQTDFATPIKKLVGAHYAIPRDLESSPVVRKKDNPYFQRTPAVLEQLSDLIPDPVALSTGLFYQTPDQDRTKGPSIGRIRQDDDFDAIVDFDVLFIPDGPKTAGLIIPQLAYHDIKDVYLAGTHLWHSSQLIEMSKDYLQNAVMVDGFFKDGQSDAVRRFVDRFQRIYGKEPGIIEAYAFDTARIFFDLLALPHIRMRHQLRHALVHSFHQDGVTGPTAFDENGEPIKSLSLLKVEGRHFREIPDL
jgi:ABC-type branched-subunit amino acid transport system substrate-binding protein